MSGLAGVGDLLLTCSSSMSRNYSVGFLNLPGKLTSRSTCSSLHNFWYMLDWTLPSDAMCVLTQRPHAAVNTHGTPREWMVASESGHQQA